MALRMNAALARGWWALPTLPALQAKVYLIFA